MKLKFNVTDFSIEEKSSSHFSIIRMKIVRDGNNLHDLPIEKDSIIKAAPTLFGKPILCNYVDEDGGRFLGHENEEVPVGVILENSYDLVEENGETWLYGNGYLWKKYFPNILDVFKKNDSKTAISMEIEVTASKINLDGKTHITGFEFLGVTLIGVTPAIPNAQGTIVQFSEMLSEVKKEFSKKYDEIDFSIPSEVKEWCNKGIEFRKNAGGGNNVSYSVANHLVNNNVSEPKKVLQMQKFFSRMDGYEPNLESPTSKCVAYMLNGGDAGKTWCNQVYEKIKEADARRTSFYSIENNDEEGVFMKKKTVEGEVIENASPATDVEEDTEDMAAPVEQDSTTMSEAPSEETPRETPETEEDMSESGGEEEAPQEESEPDGDEPKGEQEEMSLDAYADVNAMLSMLENETEQYEKMSEMFSTKKIDPVVLYNTLFAVLSKYEQSKRQLSEIKSEKFSEKVEQVLRSVEKYLPENELNTQREDSKNFSLDTFAEWEKSLKAKAFEFSSVVKEEPQHNIKVPFPTLFVGKKLNNNKSLWD